MSEINLSISLGITGMREVLYSNKPLYIDANANETSLTGKITFSSANEIYFISNLDSSKPLVKISGSFSTNSPIITADIVGSIDTITIYANGSIQDEISRKDDPILAKNLASFQKYYLKNDDYFESNAPSSQDDFVSAYEGNDSVFLKYGNDTFDGGIGVDTSIYSGKRQNFNVIISKESASVVDKAGLEGSDALINVERIKFQDTMLALDVDGGAGSIYRLYQAAFNRTPDASGLGYWIALADKGAPLSLIAAQFVGSSEFQNLYGSSNTNEKIVDIFYQNILHRSGEPSGVDYWVGVLNSGASRADVLMGFSESAENKVGVLSAIQNGFEYTAWSSP